MQNRLNDIELNCFVTDVNLNFTFLLNCNRKYRQCPYYHSHSVADGGNFENKQIIKKYKITKKRVTRCHHSVILKRSLKHFVNTTSTSVPPLFCHIDTYWHMFSLHGLG